MTNPYDPYAALKIKDYRNLFLGSVLASAAMEMLAVAVGWEVYVRTNEMASLGYIGLAQFLPVLLLSLPAGHAADKFNRKTLLVGSLFLLAAICLSFSVVSLLKAPVYWFYMLSLWMGTVRAVSVPARVALLPQVVPAELLSSAVTWNTGGWHMASVTGPAIGGIVLGLTKSAAAVYGVAAGLYLLCIVLVATIRPAPVMKLREPISFESLLAGLSFIGRTKMMLAAMTLDLFAVLLGGAVALLPVFAKDILEIGATGLGWLRAAPAVGALGMALILAHRPPLKRPGLALLLSVAGFGLATIGFGLSTNPGVSFLMLALTGALDNISMVVRGTMVQIYTPDEMRGRVSAVNAVFIGSSNELGAFESGMTAQYFGPIKSVVGGGIGTILVVILAAIQWPSVAKLGPLQHESKEKDVS